MSSSICNEHQSPCGGRVSGAYCLHLQRETLRIFHGVTNARQLKKSQRDRCLLGVLSCNTDKPAPSGSSGSRRRLSGKQRIVYSVRCEVQQMRV
jgi:hypothetical protein